MVYVYPATIQHENDGRFSIWFEDLPGCATSGESLAEAIVMARDAMGGWLDCALAHGDEIPAPRMPHEVPVGSGQDIALVDVDLDVYRRDNDNRAIKKTLTIPAWLNTRAERASINFSQILQAALKDELGVSEH